MIRFAGCTIIIHLASIGSIEGAHIGRPSDNNQQKQEMKSAVRNLQRQKSWKNNIEIKRENQHYWS